MVSGKDPVDPMVLVEQSIITETLNNGNGTVWVVSETVRLETYGEENGSIIS